MLNRSVNVLRSGSLALLALGVLGVLLVTTTSHAQIHPPGSAVEGMTIGE